MPALHSTGRIGIAHTRWATHGKPSQTNAHPHQSGKVAVVDGDMPIVAVVKATDVDQPRNLAKSVRVE